MKLVRELVVLDLETTGTWIEKDRIIEIAMVKIHPDGRRETYHTRVNPQMPIPPVVQELTGISNDDVKQAPIFSTIANEVKVFLGDADLGGFNVDRFDIPLLARELSDAGVGFEYGERAIFDAQKVYHFHEKRDLTAAYRVYCQKELENAHSALADTLATVDILEAQVKRYGEGREDLSLLLNFDYKPNADFYDDGRKFRWWNGELYMTFGKYAKKESLRAIAKKDPGYLQWMMDKDFGDDVKSMINDVLNGRHPVAPGQTAA